jgi:hypothetical protein
MIRRDNPGWPAGVHTLREWDMFRVQLPRAWKPLRQQIEASRDYLFRAAGIPQNLFSPQ